MEENIDVQSDTATLPTSLDSTPIPTETNGHVYGNALSVQEELLPFTEPRDSHEQQRFISAAPSDCRKPYGTEISPSASP